MRIAGFSAQAGDKRIHVGRQRRRVRLAFSRGGVDERKRFGMQHLAVATAGGLPLPPVPAAVDDITGHRAADVGHLHTDLMRAAGLDTQADL